MSWQDIKRITRSGFKNFSRSGVVSLSSIIVTTITLSVITGLIFVQAILNHSLSQIEEKVDVTVYFVTNTSEENIFEVRSSLEKLPEVALVEYTSSDEALISFRERHQNDYLTLQALEELSENPLGASLNIKAKDPSQYESIVKLLEGEDTGLATNLISSIDKINYHQNKLVIDRLNSIIESARYLGFIATLVLVIISIVIMFNTIRLTIHFTREEIGIMRLVGAENKYIRGPFMVEGVIYGLIATIVTIIIFIPITLWLRKSMTGFLGIDLFDYFASNFFQIFAIVLVSGILLGAVSSFLAIRKHLRT